jgi:cytochrome c-type biogenesis protein CcmH
LEAFEKARDFNAEDPHLLADTASATLLSAGDDEALRRANALFDQALANLPDHPGALMLGGVAALRSGDAAKAIERWEKLIPRVGEDEAATLRRMVESARGATNADAPATQAGPAPGSPGTLTVVLDAAPEALAAMPPGAVLFVFARDAEAGGPPVAAQRIPAPRFPLTVVLSDADRLMPTASLSQTARVQLSARFSRSGSVQSEAGDLVAPPVVVELAKAAPVSLALAPSDAPTDAARAPTFGP